MENSLRSNFWLWPQYHLFLFLHFGPLLLEAASPLYHFCGSTGNYTVNSTYDANLRSVLGSVSSGNSITYGFYNTSSGQGPERVNLIARCQGNVGLSDCHACLKESSIEIVRRCPVEKVAVIWYDNCMLMYSNKSIFGTMDGLPAFNMVNVTNVTSVTEFNKVLRDLLDGLRSRAAAGSSTLKIAAGNATAPEFKTLYGLAQCTPNLSEQQCNDCLAGSIGNMPQCCDGKVGGRWVGPSCYIRFEIYQFYDPSGEATPSPSPAAGITEPTPTTTGKGNSSNTALKIILEVVPVVAVFVLIIVLFLCTRKGSKTTVVRSRSNNGRKKNRLRKLADRIVEAMSNCCEGCECDGDWDCNGGD